MQKKILLAVDGSDRCRHGITALGQLLKDQPDYQIVLFHCVQNLSSLYVAEPDEVQTAARLLFENQQKIGDPLLQISGKFLAGSGFPTNRMQYKLKLGSLDPAQDILKEAERENVAAVAVCRRGLSQVERFLLGSISSKVAHYSNAQSVWIVDTPLQQSRKVLIAVDGKENCAALVEHAGKLLAAIPNFQFTLMHLIPSLPPIFWDEGHILSPQEQQDKQEHIAKWRSTWEQQAGQYMAAGRDLLMQKSVAPENIQLIIKPTETNIVEDLLNEITANNYNLVIIGKKSLQKKTPFLLGSHANKILYNARGVILCMVDLA